MKAELFSAAFLIGTAVPGCLSAQDRAPFPDPPEKVSSSSMLVTKDEPGEPLTIVGTVYKADGKTPYADLIMYVYQTDITGVYNKQDGNWQRPRIHGWVQTDEKGKYKIRTIKPGSYPRGRNPAHIHAIVKLPGESAKRIDDFLFEGDPYLTAELKDKSSLGSFSPVMKTYKEKDGMMVGVRDIVIK